MMPQAAGDHASAEDVDHRCNAPARPAARKGEARPGSRNGEAAVEVRQSGPRQRAAEAQRHRHKLREDDEKDKILASSIDVRRRRPVRHECARGQPRDRLGVGPPLRPRL